MQINEISQKYIKTILHYNPTTGIFTWIGSKRRGWNGKVAGSIRTVPNSQNCYIKIGKLFGRDIFAHQLAFLYMIGKIPEKIDHIDHDGLNNCWNNLREATQQQNQANRQIGKNNTSEYKGVHWFKERKCWRARIGCNGKRISLGLFSNKEDAARAYNVAAMKFFGKYAYLNEIKL